VRRPGRTHTSPASEILPEPFPDTFTRGERPRRDQVRAFGGRRDCPDSSSKHNHASWSLTVFPPPAPHCFSTPGQVSLRQLATASSSRSAARCTGTCTEKPIWCRIRLICGALKRTWKRRATRTATRSSVQRWSSTQPCAAGPSSSACSSHARQDGFIRKVAEELRDAEIELEFLTGPLAGKHNSAGHGAALFAFFAAMAESERDYIRDKTLEGQETARSKGKAIGGVPVSHDDMLATAVRLRDEEHLSLREIASRLVIRTGKKRGQHPSPATVMRMLREHDEQMGAMEPARCSAGHSLALFFRRELLGPQCRASA
jgi:Resolvase, N terminal domain